MKRLERQRPTEKVRGLWEDDEWCSSVSCMCCSALFFFNEQVCLVVLYEVNTLLCDVPDDKWSSSVSCMCCSGLFFQ
jgi:hypothetical protein